MVYLNNVGIPCPSSPPPVPVIVPVPQHLSHTSMVLSIAVDDTPSLLLNPSPSQTRISSYLKSAPTVTPSVSVSAVTVTAAPTAPSHAGTVWEKEKKGSLNALNRQVIDSSLPKGPAVDRERVRIGPCSPLRSNAHLHFTSPRILSNPIPDRHPDLQHDSTSDRDSDSRSCSDSDVSPSGMYRIGSVSTISAYEKEK